MRHFGRGFLIFASAVCAMVLTAFGGENPKESTMAEGKLRVGMYVDTGSKGNGIFHWARLLHFSPQIDLTLLDGADLRAGALDKLDLLVMPGGSGFDQYETMQEPGAEAIRRYVSGGGKYYGTCAGLATILNEAQRVKMVPYERIRGKIRGVADMPVKFSEEAAKLLDIPVGTYMIRYANGPVIQDTDPVENSNVKTIAVYDGSLSTCGEPWERSLYTLPALVYGNYGKGNILAFGCHPEYYNSTHFILFGGFYALTGKRVSFTAPRKAFSPLRVAVFSGAISGKAAVNAALALEESDQIGVRYLTAKEAGDGALEQVDVFVLPDGYPPFYKKSCAENAPMQTEMKKFLDNGGKIFAFGAGTACLPEHPGARAADNGGQLKDLILQLRQK